MLFNIQFQLSGFFLILMLLFMLVKNKSLKLLSEKIFSILLINIAVFMMFQVASAIALELYGTTASMMYVVLRKSYLLASIFFLYFLFLYILVDINSGIERFRNGALIFAVPLAVYFLLLVRAENVSGKTLSYIDIRSGETISLIFGAFYLGCSLLYVVKFRHKLEKVKFYALWILLVVSCITLTVQSFIEGVHMLGLFIAFAMNYIFMKLENPEDNIDIVTGCFNANAFRRYMKELKEDKREFALTTIVFDDFRFVNETFGTENANRLLKEIVIFLETLKGVRVFKGEKLEFIIVYRNMEEMLQALDSIEKKFRLPWNIKGVDVAISISISYLADSHMVRTVDDMFGLVNYFVEECRKRGKRTVIPINEEEYLRKIEMDHVETTLRNAIKHDLLQVYFQPIYSIKEERFVSAEALVRLQDEMGKFISPELFIPIAEKSGLILELGMMVFDKVCRFMKQKTLEKLGIKYVEINLSVVQCMQDTLAEELLAVMKKYSIQPEQINLEITETAAANSEKVLEQTMNDLIKEKVSFSLDDYGSGYSNLSHVVELPLAIVKLDKSLVWSAFENEKAKVAMEFAISMIRSLGMRVLAEGIETKEQYERMKQLEIDYIQGYLFSKPVNGEEFLNVISKEINVI